MLGGWFQKDRPHRKRKKVNSVGEEKHWNPEGSKMHTLKEKVEKKEDSFKYE